MPRVGLFGVVFPRDLAGAAPRASARFHHALPVGLKKYRREAGSFLGFLGLTISLRDDGGDVIASLVLPKQKIKKIADSARQLRL